MTPRGPSARALGLACVGAVIATAVGVAPPATAEATARPRLCWRQLEQMPLAAALLPRTGGQTAASVWVTDGAHPPVRLQPNAAGESTPLPRGQFTVRGEDPQLFVQAGDERPIWLWVRAPGDAMRRLTIALARGAAAACEPRGAAPPESLALVVEAVTESGGRTCLAWAPATQPAERPAACVPIGVPQLVGRHLDEARSILAEHGLALGALSARSSLESQQVVLSQQPVADPTASLATGDTVDLVISGQQLVATPAIVGRSVAVAQALVEAAGLGLDVRSGGVAVELERVLDFEVQQQDPPAPELTPVGGQIAAEVALRLPDLRGAPLAEALRRLRDGGLDPATGALARLLPAANLRVAAHRPATGELVAWNGRVSLATETATPRLRGLTLGTAERRLGQRGLELARLGEAPVDAASERVRAQSPPAGEPLPPGAAVTVTLGVLTPDVEGATVEQATSRLAARGLRLGLAGGPDAERRARANAAHRLAAQRPAPGTVAPAGMAVVAMLEVQMPNLLWRDAGGAMQRLRELGMDSGRPQPHARGSLRRHVVAQDPVPGTWMAGDATVQLELGPGLAPPLVGPRWPWLSLTLVLALGSVLVRPRTRRPRGLQVEAHPDAGRQTIAGADDRAAPPAFCLRPRWDPGRQTLSATDPTQGGPDA